jgi:hypothetical protein
LIGHFDNIIGPHHQNGAFFRVRAANSWSIHRYQANAEGGSFLGE